MNGQQENLADLYSGIVADWEESRSPDAAQALSRHPDLAANKSFALDLAYHEYQTRTAHGEEIDTEEFCDRFPIYRRSLHRLLQVHDYLQRSPELLGAGDQLALLDAGDEFRNFELLGELGKGAFSRVFLARDAMLGNRVVVLKLSLLGGSEAFHLGQLEHPNVVPVHSAGLDDASGLSYLCMPYLGCATLYDVIDVAFATPAQPTSADCIFRAAQTRLHPQAPKLPGSSSSRNRDASFVAGATKLAVQIAEGLVFTHNRGFLHGDLKPSNVLVSPDGTARLLDFNLSMTVGAELGRAGGTLPYLAPEQLVFVFHQNQDRGVLTPASDLFSLGAVLFELYTGELPFGEPDQNLSASAKADFYAQKHRAGTPSVRQINGSVPRDIASIIEHCLQIDANRRPPNAEHVRDGLLQYLGKKRRRIRRRSVLLGGAVFTLVVAGGVSAGLNRSDSSESLLRRGRVAIREKRFDDAIACYDKCLAQSPDSVDAHLLRGQAYLATGEPTLAVLDFKLASENSDAGLPDGWLGYALNTSRINAQAAHCYERAIEKGERDARIFNNLGYSFGQLSHFARAREAVTKGIEADDSLQVLWHNRARFELGLFLDGHAADLSTAAEDVDRAIQIGPLSAHLCLTAAQVYAARAGDSTTFSGIAADWLLQGKEYGVNGPYPKSQAEIAKNISDEGFAYLANFSSPTASLFVEPGRKTLQEPK